MHINYKIRLEWGLEVASNETKFSKYSLGGIKIQEKRDTYKYVKLQEQSKKYNMCKIL